MRLALVAATIAGCLNASAQTRQFVRADAMSADIVSYRPVGGAFKSYGCKPIDPTY